MSLKITLGQYQKQMDKQLFILSFISMDDEEEKNAYFLMYLILYHFLLYQNKTKAFLPILK